MQVLFRQFAVHHVVMRHDAVGGLRDYRNSKPCLCPHQGGAGIVGNAEDLRGNPFLLAQGEQDFFKAALKDER